MCNTTGASAKSVTLPATNFSDWAISDQAVDTITMANTADSLDTVETMKVTIQNVKNIYKNSDVPITEGATNSGVRLVVSLHGVWSEKDTSDSTLPVHYAPVACSITTVVPKWASVTSSDVLALIGRTLSGYFETDDTVSDPKRIAKMLRGIERPSDVN